MKSKFYIIYIYNIGIFWGCRNTLKTTVTTVTTVTLAWIFTTIQKKLKKSGIFRILHYLYLQMSKICRNFVVSKDKAERAVIKEKNC